ncbi:right-handed parallel beta-helix repeat-containing protein [Caballeronia sp. LZ065]|uniref:right-handed parallel beta-helix repeat-containing protein n=1 Tax=Caballeronia sp. LZ065 TaxID=3038571 RepID=UPI0028542FFD|nr:right-handed parallel beta-helix repeat-containing protein [Caballeronia sp. LZ065]MDR5781697.1 right-handed parallel beta-helix repeat-containing protein [Caballeronia sp. LZ065]
MNGRRTALKKLRALAWSTMAGAAGLRPVEAATAQSGRQDSADEVVDRWFGVRADGRTNDREALQKAVDSSVGKTLVITGPSRIDAAGVHLRSRSHVRFVDGASIKLLPHRETNYEILRIWDVQHVVVERPRLDGSKDLNTAKGGEWGMGISIAGSSDVTILSPYTIDCWGDGIYISNSFHGGLPYSSDLRIMNHYASGCRRQGTSIISGKNVLFDHPVWENIAGTPPAAGLDIEPNFNTDVLENIRIVDPVTRNCQIGILVWLAALPGVQDKHVTISIEGHHDEGSRDAAFSVSRLKTEGRIVTGSISSRRPTWVHPKRHAFVNSDWDSAGPRVDVSDSTIIR